jgi:malonyl-CoA O-methyltransferase
MLNKEKIKKQFSRSAEKYDLHAHLQQEIGQELFNKIDFTPQKILDLGCGTGTLTLTLARRFPQARIFGTDIAPGMICIAQKKAALAGLEQVTFTVEDMEAPAYPNGSFDLVLSNLSLQWVNHRLETFQKIHGLLGENGVLLFSTFGHDSLRELRASARHVLGLKYKHEQKFPEQTVLARELARAGFLVRELQSEHKERSYDSPEHLLRSLKNIGAQNASAHRPEQLMTRRELAMLSGHYQELFGSKQKIRATYEIIFAQAVVAKKRA